MMDHEEIIRRITVAMEEAKAVKQRHRDSQAPGCEFARALGVLEGNLVALIWDLRQEANEELERVRAAVGRKR